MLKWNVLIPDVRGDRSDRPENVEQSHYIAEAATAEEALEEVWAQGDADHPELARPDESLVKIGRVLGP